MDENLANNTDPNGGARHYVFVNEGCKTPSGVRMLRRRLDYNPESSSYYYWSISYPKILALYGGYLGVSKNQSRFMM
jgi:hypothetical protein